MMIVLIGTAWLLAGAALSAGAVVTPEPPEDVAVAQGRASENVIAAAEDAFGTSVRNETIGLYSAANVRGFSPIEAGNLRIEGLYFDQRGGLVGAVRQRSTVRVGLSAQSYPLPAPTGIVDYTLRPASSRPSLSVVGGVADYGGYYVELDASTAVSPTVSLNAGVALAHREYVSGSNIWFLDTGVIGRWRPGTDTAVTAFFSRYGYWDQEASPIVFASEGLPPPIPRRRYFGQPWAQWEGRAQNVGLLGDVRRGPWRFEAGLFSSEFTQDRFAAQLFNDVTPSGIGERTIISGADQFSSSISGEARLSRDWIDGPRAHRVFVSIRGRDVASEFGGYDIRSFGPGSIYDPQLLPEPARSYGPTDRDEQTQIAGAGGWSMIWPDRLEASVGLQRASYEKTALPASGGAFTSRQTAWLWNASVAGNVTSRLVAYAGMSRGLEDSGTAPNNASNRGQPLPALITAQSEAGLRYRFAGGISLLAGWFEIEKPYFSVDPSDGLFRALGDVVHTGTELSVSGQPIQGLTVIAGAVLLDARVRGQAVGDGLVRSRPLGRPDVTATINLDYSPPRHRAWSVDLGISHTGRQAASMQTDIVLPARTIFDTGVRYRFDWSGRPVTARLQIRNLSNANGLNVTNGGGFSAIDSRRFIASLASDF
jgi:iron complex outermembrane receptor protein